MTSPISTPHTMSNNTDSDKSPKGTTAHSKPADEEPQLNPHQLFSQPTIDQNGLSWPGKDTTSRINETPASKTERLDKMREAIKTLLSCMGEDPNREGLLATPSRYAQALLFLTEGYGLKLENVVNKAVFHEDHHEMVVVKDIEFHSLCEHHLVPFTGKMHIGYIPCGTVIGLSKLPRIAQMFARRLQIQERLTQEVAYAVQRVLKPRGVVVVMESSHLCMVMRGVEKSGSTTITTSVVGCFGEDKMRREFLGLVGSNRMR